MSATFTFKIPLASILYLLTYSESTAWNFHLIVTGISVNVPVTSEALLNVAENIQLFRERLSGKNVLATTPKGNMGYDQYTVLNDCSCRTFILLLLSISTHEHMSMAYCAVLSNFFGEQYSKPSTYRDCRLLFSYNLSRNSCMSEDVLTTFEHLRSY